MRTVFGMIVLAALSGILSGCPRQSDVPAEKPAKDAVPATESAVPSNAPPAAIKSETETPAKHTPPPSAERPAETPPSPSSAVPTSPAAIDFPELNTITGDEWNALAKAIVEQRTLLGKTEAEIVALLGPPDQRLHRLIYAFRSVEGRNKRTPEMLVNLDTEGRLESVGNVAFLDGPQPMTFTEEGWRSGVEGVRFHMAMDLRLNNPLKGKTRDEVLRILDVPSREVGPALMYNARTRADDGSLFPDATGNVLRVDLKDGQVNELRFIER